MVLTWTSGDAQEDLKAIMSSVQRMNQEKKAWREVQEEVNRAAAKLGDESERALDVTDELDDVPGAMESFLAEPVAVDSIHRAVLTHRDLIDAITAALADPEVVIPSPGKDSPEELEQLRLQMHLGRIAKLERKLANAMAKASETASSIIANLK